MIKVGDIVECRYFDTPEQKFYGEVFQAEVVEVVHKYEFFDRDTVRYIVKRDNFHRRYVVLERKEIKRVVK